MIAFIRSAINDLIRSQDGSVSLTKLAATTAHANAAWLFVYLNLTREPTEWLWLIYLGVTVTHAAYDKTAKIVQAMKEKANAQPDP